MSITLSLLKGDYLDYRGVVPESFQTEAILEKDIFRRSVERAALMSTDGRNNLIKLDFSEDELTITSRSDSGYFQDRIPIRLTGTGIVIGFNSKYILDGLKAIDEETIRFRLESNIKPCTITPENGEYLYMILPVRVS